MSDDEAITAAGMVERHLGSATDLKTIEVATELMKGHETKSILH